MSAQPRLAGPRCEAVNKGGYRCRAGGTLAVELPGRGPHLLCPVHADVARLRPDALEVLHAVPAETGPPRRAPRWSDDDDAYLVGHPELTAAEAATHLGRSRKAVLTRRAALRRGEEGP